MQGGSCAPPHGLAPLADGATTFSPMPPLHMAWVASDRPPPVPVERSALVPIYEDPSREVLLSEVRLPCTNDESVWLQAGCALFLSVDS